MSIEKDQALALSKKVNDGLTLSVTEKEALTITAVVQGEGSIEWLASHIDWGRMVIAQTRAGSKKHLRLSGFKERPDQVIRRMQEKLAEWQPKLAALLANDSAGRS